MRVYIVQPGAHHKNVESIRKMMVANNVKYTECDDLRQIDDSYTLVFCCTRFFPPSAFPNTCKVVYGPQFFVFPDDQNHPIHRHSYEPGRFFYNSLSPWVKTIHEQFAPNLSLKFVTCPFGLDIDSIQQVPSASQRSKVMIYFKHRHPDIGNKVISFLRSKNIEYDLIQYGSYNDADFKNRLQNTKFVIWVGSHESQGFAFQETLASNVPILLWDVRSMHDEYSKGYPYRSYIQPLLATTANVWSPECGIKIFNENDLEPAFNQMNSSIEAFNPRRVIESEVSLNAAYRGILNAIGL
jgi:hypothetical protein